MPLRVCVEWSQEFVCDRLHLSFGQSQAVSAVHRELNCFDGITLDHGFELHDHMPPLKHWQHLASTAWPNARCAKVLQVKTSNRLYAINND